MRKKKPVMSNTGNFFCFNSNVSKKKLIKENRENIMNDFT
jgi:hypothetical protein